MEGGDRSRVELESAALDVWLDFSCRRSSVGEPGFEELCRAHAHLAGELRRLKAAHDSSGEATTPSSPTGLEANLAERLHRLAQPVQRGARFEREGVIARGGMGAIYRVRDLDLDRTLALKEMAVGRPGQNVMATARFLEEAQITAQLDHPGIVPIHEIGLDKDGRLTFAMKLVQGHDLRELLDFAREGHDTWTQIRILGVLQKVCEAMAYAHSKGVIHRDLKPGNVMVGRFGEVYVMDWGLARAMGRQDVHDLRLQVPDASESLHTERREEREETPDSPLVTMDGVVVGTPAYMPPEQARGEIQLLSPRSDVYSIGAMLYHLLSGQTPYVPPGSRLSKHTVLARVIQGPPERVHELNRAVPLELVAICEKAMAREPDQRYPDTLALGEDLRAYLEGRVVHAFETGAVAELRKWVARNKALASSAAAALMMLVAGLTASLILEAKADHNAQLAEQNATTARSNEQRALAGEALANREKERADRAAALARQSEQLATARADEVLRLSAFQRLADLESEADRLWPAVPENIPRYDRWLARARDLVGGLDPHGDDPGHRAQLAKQRERAAPPSPEQREAQRRAHPRFAELAALEKKVAALRVARDVRAGQAEPARFALDPSTLPAGADGLNELARPLVDPARAEFGREAEGLALARLAIERVEDDASAARAGDTLAWALLANGLDDQALAESAAVLEAIGPEAREEHVAEAAELRSAVEEGRRGLTLARAESELSALEAEVSSSAGNDPLADERDTWWQNQLEKLVAEIEAFADPKTGWIDGTPPEHGWGIAKRRAFAAALVERSIASDRARELWADACAAIADPKDFPRYGGLRISPQLGLLPLGPDLDSELWEFADLATGEPAERGGDGKLVRTEAMGVVFVLLPGGTFRMGAQRNPARSNYDPVAESDEAPVREVTVPPFFLSKYEMTQAQWARFTGRNPSFYNPGSYDRGWNRSGRAIDLLHPVEQVSWTSCKVTCSRLGWLLPSESQWEYAARAGTQTPWWTGAEPDGLAAAGNVADQWAQAHGAGPDWVCEAWDDGNMVHAAVGSYRANAFGLHDVIGNVWEWCEDDYGASSHQDRGGSYFDTAVNARSSHRKGDPTDLAANTIGLRPARALAP